LTAPETPHWTEEDTHLYREIAAVAVPARAEQLATLLSLLPFGVDDSFHAVEIGAGQGFLSEALLACFPHATVLALDGSADMRSKIGGRLAKLGRRGMVEPFDLPAAGWRHHLKQADAVLSSLCLHHLSGPEKQALFANIADGLSAGGALLIADLVEPQRPEARALFAATWDRSVVAQSRVQTGSDTPASQFCRAEWNLFRYPDPPVDKPSPLFEQLRWLQQAGFVAVDCFWMQAGHAIFGGYKPAKNVPKTPLGFDSALKIVESVLIG
jgi:tRNA (cmo5U34)-methyltransferase